MLDILGEINIYISGKITKTTENIFVWKVSFQTKMSQPLISVQLQLMTAKKIESEQQKRS